MKRVAAAPCQCSSPARRTRGRRGGSSRPARRAAGRGPTPSSTKIVWPFGCVCQAVRAPGVKWTLLALTREAPDGAATGVDVDGAGEPIARGRGSVSRLLLVICTSVSFRSASGEQTSRLRAGSSAVGHGYPGHLEMDIHVPGHGYPRSALGRGRARPPAPPR